MITHEIIKKNLEEIRAAMSVSAHRAGRNVQDIRLMAVTKLKPADVIQSLIDLGIKDIGENYPDETVKKIEVFQNAPEDVNLHMIGHCQSRKAKIVADYFDSFQSLDRLDIGIKLNSILEKKNKKMPVFLEFNTGEELHKKGWILKGPNFSDNFLRDLEQLQNCSQLDIRGLMTLPPFTENAEENRYYFANLRQVLENLNSHYGTRMTELSMGTSIDYCVAIEEGATFIRLGTVLVGPRA